MADILSQEEVAALVQAVSEGEIKTQGPVGGGRGRVAAKDVTPYDFLRPATVPEKQSGVIQMVHERFARLLANGLTAKLNLIAEVKFLSIEQMPFGEFEPTIPNPCTLALVNMDGFDGRVLIALHPLLGFAIVDRVLGGAGAVDSEPRPFTEIEQLIIDDVVTDAMKQMEKAWDRIAPSAMSVTERHGSVQMIQYVSSEEMIVVATVEARIKETTGLLTVCYPFRIMDFVGRHIRGGLVRTEDESNQLPKGNAQIRNEVNHVPIEVTAQLGSASVRIRDVLRLQEGDVLLLNRQIQDALELQVGGKLRYKGYLGMHREKMAFAISERRL